MIGQARSPVSTNVMMVSGATAELGRRPAATLRLGNALLYLGLDENKLASDQKKLAAAMRLSESIPVSASARVPR
jgi:hypothetical protein